MSGQTETGAASAAAAIVIDGKPLEDVQFYKKLTNNPNLQTEAFKLLPTQPYHMVGLCTLANGVKGLVIIPLGSDQIPEWLSNAMTQSPNQNRFTPPR